ncbi:tRNA pseudouridine(13) synthase TruD [Nanoarchaeota archaeon]
MYNIKQKPEDFIVEEVLDLELDRKGDFVYFSLKKIGYTTMQCITRIQEWLHVKPGRVGFAGIKDKQAITTQTVSIRDPNNKIPQNAFDHFNKDRIILEFIGRGKTPIHLGMNKGNRFNILVSSPTPPEKTSWITNYFDDQRFSINNPVVGKAIIKKDWETAAKEILADPVKNHLKTNPRDYIGALKTLPLKTLLIYVHSYQSYIWNETVKKYLQQKYSQLVNRRYTLGLLYFPVNNPADPDIEVPIVGFGTEYDNPEIKQIIQDILKKEDLIERDFINRQFPELSCDGGSRKIFIKLEDVSIEKEDKDYRLKFFLPSGAYATMVIKRFFGN